MEQTNNTAYQKSGKNSNNTRGKSGSSYKQSNSTNKNKKTYYTNKNYKKKYYSSKKGRFHRKPAEETIDEIKRDIRRIEKEIRLEIEEIKSMKV